MKNLNLRKKSCYQKFNKKKESLKDSFFYDYKLIYFLNFSNM